MAGHDTGLWIGYALAADHPYRVDCLAVAEAAMPGVSASPPLFGSTQANNQLWPFAFNRLAEVNEQLVIGREVGQCRWPHRCWAACRVTPSRTAISAQE